MPRKVLVATTAFANQAGRSLEKNIEMGLGLLDAAGAQHPDLICLPEVFPQIGVPKDQLIATAEKLDGPVIAALAERARRFSTYVIAGTNLLRGEIMVNTALLFDRQGQIVGQYEKVHPTIGEIHAGTTPGSRAQVFETDFGRVGIAICYDIGWPQLWDELAAQGAELVVWPSAYDGGWPLQHYAWRQRCYVVSSVWTWHSKIIDITGQVLASTSRWQPLVVEQIDLEKEVFHTDENAAKLTRLQAELGRRISLRSYSEEHLFTLESNDPSLPLDRVISQYGLETFRDYHARAEAVQDQAREAAFHKAGNSA